MLDYIVNRPVEERLRDWKEVTRSTSNYLRKKEESKHCMDCGVPFCQSDSGCPVDNLIPEWNRLVADGRWEEAFHRLHQTNNFPEFTGSLCPAPCESACVMGIDGNPVAIKSIEWSIVDYGFKEGWVKPQLPKSLTGKKVAIIGSGPAGLAAAQQLARQGHSVTVFEKQSLLGGLLRYGIPDFKFEKWRIDKRLEQLKLEGVVFKTSTQVGRDIEFSELQNQYDAIGLAIGAERPRDLKIPGRELNGICLAMDYLTEQNKLNSGEISKLSHSAEGKRVIILGGGDTGSDCLGTALRQNARSVVQIEIQDMPPDKRSSSTPWPQTPFKLKTSHAHEEGGERIWGLQTLRFEGENNLVKKLVAVQKNKNGNEIEFETDLVILALGFQGFDSSQLRSLNTISETIKGTMAVNKDHQTSVPGVFAAGDLTRGASLIVWAIADGRKMANGIHTYLTK